MAIRLKPEGIPETEAVSRVLRRDPSKRPVFTDIVDRLFKQVKSEEVMFFTSQLSLMLEVDTPVTVALKTIANEIKNTVLKAAINAIAQDIEEGRQLS